MAIGSVQVGGFAGLREVTARMDATSVARADGQGATFEELFGDLMAESDRAVRHPYEGSLYAHAAISNIAVAIGGLPPRLFTIKDEPIEDMSHELVKLLQEPNPEQDAGEFLEASGVHREVDGIVHWVEPEWEMRKPPRERAIYIASRSEMEPITDGGRLVAWRYTPWDTGRSQTLRLDQVETLRRYHPRKRLDGLPAATVARMAIDSHYYASRMNKSALKNGTDVGLIATTDHDLRPEQVEDLLTVLRERHGGPGNAKKPAVFWGGVKIDRGTQGMKDLDWLEGKRLSAQEIATAFGVPPIFVGLFDEAHLNNSLVQERLFWTQYGLPQKKRIVRAMNRFFLRGERTRYYVELDTSGIQSLKAEEAEFMERAFGLTEHGIARNEVNRRFDLGFEEPPWGEVPLVSAGRIPQNILVDEAQAALAGEKLPEGSESDDDDADAGKAVAATATRMAAAADEARAATRGIREALGDRTRSATSKAIHQRWKKSWYGLLVATQVRCNKFFRRQLREMRARLKQIDLPYGPDVKAYAVRATFDDLIKFVLFDLDDEDGKLTTVLRPAIGDGLELGGKQISSEVGGFEFEVDNPDVAAHLEGQAIRVRDVNKTTAGRIKRTLQKGLEGGETLAELGSRIDAILGTEAAGKPGRGYVIAQTEMHEAISAGRAEGMKQSGVDGKKWLSAGGPTVRRAHRFAEADTRNDPIPLDELFDLVDEDGALERARYPGDSSLSPGNRINCSCVSLAATLKSDQKAAAAYAARAGEYTYDDLLAERRENKQRETKR